MSTFSNSVDYLYALEQVRGTIFRYCDMVDTRNIAGLGDLFDEEAVFGDPVTHRGRDEIIDYYGAALAALQYSCHHTTNHRVEFTASDEAGASSNFLAALERDAQLELVFGRYSDRLVCRDGVWRFAQKINRIDRRTALASGSVEAPSGPRK